MGVVPCSLLKIQQLKTFYAENTSEDVLLCPLEISCLDSTSMQFECVVETLSNALKSIMY